MATYSSAEFAHTVMRDLDLRQRRDIALSKSMQASAIPVPVLESKALGHPDFEDLPIGDRRTVPITAVFLDLSDFTGRSFWDDIGDVANLAHAVLSGFVETVLRFGGFPLGL